jgi:hypothetical protein
MFSPSILAVGIPSEGVAPAPTKPDVSAPTPQESPKKKLLQEMNLYLRKKLQHDICPYQHLLPLPNVLQGA